MDVAWSFLVRLDLSSQKERPLRPELLQVGRFIIKSSSNQLITVSCAPSKIVLHRDGRDVVDAQARSHLESIRVAGSDIYLSKFMALYTRYILATTEGSSIIMGILDETAHDIFSLR